LDECQIPPRIRGHVGGELEHVLPRLASHQGLDALCQTLCISWSDGRLLKTPPPDWGQPEEDKKKPSMPIYAVTNARWIGSINT
jgi:hypothetical protein